MDVMLLIIWDLCENGLSMVIASIVNIMVIYSGKFETRFVTNGIGFSRFMRRFGRKSEYTCNRVKYVSST